MNIVILDDELHDASLLKEICDNYFSSINISYKCTVLTEAKELLDFKVETIDLILLDIDIPDYSGIELAERIKQVNKKCFICFVTKYPNYVFESHHIHAFDYIVKPIRQNEIVKVLNDFIDLLNNNPILLNTKIQFDTVDGIALLECAEILFFEYYERYTLNGKKFNRITKINTINKTYLIKSNIKKIYESLPKELFIIPHQSYIINMSYIKLLKSTEIIMSDNTIIPISQKRLSETKNLILHYFRTLKGEN